MDVIQVVSLALLQGITEFLPISSSAHLILLPYFADWPDQGPTFDVAVHVGTLAAVVVYFRRELATMLEDWRESLRVRARVGESRMVWFIVGATVPAGIAGLCLELIDPAWPRSPGVIAAATVGFGLLLWWADSAGSKTRSDGELAWKDVIIVGLAQALALIPGTSRSGVTITAGLALGLTRTAAARFSFLLAIPVIALAGAAKLYAAVQSEAITPWGSLALGSALAFVSAYLCIRFFLALIARMGLLPFVIYRLLLGAVIFAMVN